MPEPVSVLHEEYSLPSGYTEHLNQRDVTHLFQTQLQALENGLLSEDNFLMVAEPGTGKTLAAEFAIVDNAISSSSDLSIFLVPFRALAEEKAQTFQTQLGDEFNLEVRSSLGGERHDPEELFNSNILVMTYEKFDHHLRNHTSYLSNIGLVVIDEFQTLGKEQRGPSLEILTTRLLSDYPDIRIVGLSATTPNYEDVSDWLQGRHSDSGSWRKCPLHEGMYIKQDRELVLDKEDGQIRADIPSYSGNTRIDPVIDYLREDDDNQALVFAQTRSEAETIATNLRDYLVENQRSSSIYTDSVTTTNLKKSITDADGGPAIDKLSKCVKHGVGFHHAGISDSVKQMVVDAVEEETLRVIISTTTLGAGINLPVDRVYIPKPRVGADNDEYGRDLTTSEYKNLAGRAGRPQYGDDPGEAILYADNQLQASGRRDEYIDGDVETVTSEIDPAELSVVLNLLRECNSVSDATDYLQQSFLSQSTGFDEASIRGGIRGAVNQLSDLDMVTTDGDEVSLTDLGEATSRQLISPKAVHAAITYLRQVGSLDDFEIVDLLVVLASTSELENCRLFSWQFSIDHDTIRQELPVLDLTDEDLKNAVLTGYVIADWVNGEDLEDIFDELQVAKTRTKTDIKERAAPRLARSLKYLQEILEEADEDLDDEFSDRLGTLESQVRYGLPEDQVPFAECGITKNKGLISHLQNRVGIDHPREIAQGSVSQLFGEVSDSKPYEFTRIAVNEFCESPEKERKHTLLDARAVDGPGITKIRNLLESNHTEFQNHCEEYLETLDYLQFEPVDESGQDRFVEGYLRVLDRSESRIIEQDGTPLEIAVECKSKDDLSDDVVGAEDATDVVRKADGQPYMVTIGNPGFDADAVDDAKRQGVLLLPASAFATLVINAHKGRTSPEIYANVFTTEGQLTRPQLLELLNE